VWSSSPSELGSGLATSAAVLGDAALESGVPLQRFFPVYGLFARVEDFELRFPVGDGDEVALARGEDVNVGRDLPGAVQRANADEAKQRPSSGVVAPDGGSA